MVREKQDRAKAADEDQNSSAHEDSKSEKRGSKAHYQTSQWRPTRACLNVALNSRWSRLFPPRGPKLRTNPCESVSSL
jgi:hypothetical protein